MGVCEGERGHHPAIGRDSINAPHGSHDLIGQDGNLEYTINPVCVCVCQCAFRCHCCRLRNRGDMPRMEGSDSDYQSSDSNINLSNSYLLVAGQLTEQILSLLSSRLRLQTLCSRKVCLVNVRDTKLIEATASASQQR